MASSFLQDLMTQLGIRPEKPFDPAVFSDPLAQKTSWQPLQKGGINFCSHGLRQKDSLFLEFKTTLVMKIFCSFFILFGLFFSFLPVAVTMGRNHSFPVFLLGHVLFGLIFAGVGAGILYRAEQPIVFDKRRGMFCKGRGTSNASPGLRNCTDLARIRGLQILSEYCRGNKSSYYSYELNLVLDDASRVNVVDHGDLKRLRKDALVLGEFLGVPVWDMQLAGQQAAVSAPREDDWSSLRER